MRKSFRIATSVSLALVFILGVTVIAIGGTIGGDVYAQYCAGCHGAGGEGTALGPRIQGESAGEVISYTRLGDGSAMPPFDASVISDTELDALAAYIGGMTNTGGTDGHDGASDYQYGRIGNGDDSKSHDNAAAGQYEAPAYHLSLLCGTAYWASWDDYVNHLLSVDYVLSNTGTGEAEHVKVEGATGTNGVTPAWYSATYWHEIAAGDSVSFSIKWLIPVNVGSFISSVEVCADCGGIRPDDASDDDSDTGYDSCSDDDSDDASCYG